MKQRRLIHQLNEKGWKNIAIAKALGVRQQTISEWHQGKKVARDRHIVALQQLLSTAPPPTPKRRRAQTQESTQIGHQPLDVPAVRARFFRNLLSGLGITRRELAEHLEISPRSLDNLLDPNYTTNLLALIPAEKLEKLATKPFSTLYERFHAAAKIIFGPYYYIAGYDDDPREKEVILNRLSDLTGYHKRTLGRYLPSYVAGGPHFLTHAIVIAFEAASGAIVRPKPSVKPRRTPHSSR